MVREYGADACFELSCGLALAADYLREQSGLQAELARAEVADLCRFSENIDALTARIVRRVKDLGSTLPTLPGCAELTAAKLIRKPLMWTASPMRAPSPDTLASHRFRRGQARQSDACVYAPSATGRSTPPSIASL